MLFVENLNQQLFNYIQNAPTAFHAVDAAKEMLVEAGFSELKENEAWTLLPGKSYFVTRNLSALIAFRLPKTAHTGFQIVASHTDSPCFKIKEKGITACGGKYELLNTEMYGGAIASSWLDRPLSVAGRVMLRTENGIQPRLICADQDMLVIPNLCIHQNRSINDGKPMHNQTDMLPLYSLGGISFKEKVAQLAGVCAEDILAEDLFVYNRMPGTVWGPEEELLSAPRLDDLECAFSSIRALIDAETVRNVAVSGLFDNEEVGSCTRQGADSSFLQDILSRIDRCLGLDEQAHRQRIAASFMVSADNAHAAHPNHPETSDPVNRVWMNEGIVVKFSGNQKYTSDAVSAAVFRTICDRAGVPTQSFYNHSDQRGGSTLGNLSGRHVSVTTVDIGLAQLAMHSSWETAGVQDLSWMVKGMTAFFETALRCDGDCSWTIA
jgi:aspartyl aminopeptidase